METGLYTVTLIGPSIYPEWPWTSAAKYRISIARVQQCHFTRLKVIIMLNTVRTYKHRQTDRQTDGKTDGGECTSQADGLWMTSEMTQNHRHSCNQLIRSFNGNSVVTMIQPTPINLTLYFHRSSPAGITMLCTKLRMGRRTPSDNDLHTYG